MLAEIQSPPSLARTRPWPGVCAALAVCLLAGCSWQEPVGPGSAGNAEPASTPAPATAGGAVDPQAPLPQRARAVEAALAQLGRPYRYGGTDPARGFDCSGLVHYAYAQAGYRAPRTTGQLWRTATPLRVEHLRPGDVVFFAAHDKPTHVGLYVGSGEFVHAPSSGKRVRMQRLDDEYYRRRFRGAGRLLPQ